MTVQVRFKPLDLSDGSIVNFEADGYEIMKDNTVVLMCDGNRVGHVHPDRWDSVRVMEQAT